MIDKTAAATASFGVEKAIDAAGNNDQWRRHLEKALFERQREAIWQSDDDSNRRTPHSQETLAKSALDGQSSFHTAGLDTAVRQEAIKPQAMPQTRNQSQAALQQPRVPAQSPPATGTRAGEVMRSAVVSKAVGFKTAAPGRDIAHTWRGELPGTSAAHLLKTKNGFCLVIRDAVLSKESALRLFDRLRTMFAADGRRLSSFTFNGEVLSDVRRDGDAGMKKA